jgi:carbon monoxide dehydrogenase subunit G
MHLAGETDIAATRQRVWDTIGNPDKAAASSSGGHTQIEKIDDRHYKVTVSSPVGVMPVKAVLNLELTDVDAPSRIAATIEGTIMNGPINGTGSIDLAELAPKLTRATWVADATFGGMLGGVDGMLQGPLQGAAEKTFDALKERIEAEEAAAGG